MGVMIDKSDEFDRFELMLHKANRTVYYPPYNFRFTSLRDPLVCGSF